MNKTQQEAVTHIYHASIAYLNQVKIYAHEVRIEHAPREILGWEMNENLRPVIRYGEPVEGYDSATIDILVNTRDIQKGYDILNKYTYAHLVSIVLVNISDAYVIVRYEILEDKLAVTSEETLSSNPTFEEVVTAILSQHGNTPVFANSDRDVRKLKKTHVVIEFQSVSWAIASSALQKYVSHLTNREVLVHLGFNKMLSTYHVLIAVTSNDRESTKISGI